MSKYYITSENTEDTFDCTDNLDDAVRIAEQLAMKSQSGDPVCIEHEGKVVRQFVLMPDGKIAEEALA